MTRPAFARPAALLLSLALLLAACGSAGPSGSPSDAAPSPSDQPSAAASPTPDPSPAASPAAGVDAAYDAIVDQVLELRGLQPATVERETIDEAKLKELSAADFDTDNPAEYVAANERMYKALGLMPEGASLREVFLDLIGSQVAGFYRPDDKKLYVVSRSGAVNGADKITFAHEYDHALQDANFDVFGDPEQFRDQTDQALARAAVYEGDATLLMSQWAIPNLTPAEIQDVVSAGGDPEANAIMARTPAILTESLLFPYNTGLMFVQPIQAAGGWEGVDAVYDRLPTSTEQVMHPEKYQADEAPVTVDLPDGLASGMGDGWTEAFQDTWGEFQTGIWLRERGVGTGAADAAAGWGGDRLAVLNGPDGAWAVVLSTTWDTAADATEFESAAQMAVSGLGHPAAVTTTGPQDVIVTIASDEDALVSLDKVLGATGV